MTAAEELKLLREKLVARRNQPGFAANVRAIEARISELEASNAG